MFSIGFLFEIFYCFIVQIILRFFFWQNWADYADMSQGMVVYVIYASDVLLLCWFGTQLTQHVRQDGLLLLLLSLLEYYVPDMETASIKTGKYCANWAASIFLYYAVFGREFSFAETGNIILSISRFSRN